MRLAGGLLVVLGAALLSACSTVPETRERVEAEASKAGEPILIETQMALADGHSFPVEILLPDMPGEYPLLVFSAGNFASPDRYSRLLEPIAEAGYVIASPVHPDAEVLALDPPADPMTVWQRRNAEFAYLAGAPQQLQIAARRYGVEIDGEQLGLVGHSYGALIAQTAAGAQAWRMMGEAEDRTIPEADVLVAFSPPGPVPDAIFADGWQSIALPSFTQSGTADILPGFVDDWRDHITSYEQTAPGERWLWVGEGVDHYFGGVYGREKPAPAEVEAKFDHALLATIAFLDIHLKDAPDRAPPAPEGVTLTKD